MNALLLYMVQMIAASGLLYGYYHLALRNNQFHQYNRFYLLAIPVISIILPFLNIPFYFTAEEKDSSFVLQTLSVIAPVSTDEISTSAAKTAVSAGSISTANLLLYIYLFIAAVVLLRIVFSLLRIRRIIRNNSREQLGNIHFINTTEPGTPFSFFRWLFWNRQIDLHSEKGEQVFRHELFHIEQKHSYDIVYAELLTVIGWLNPFFYLIKKELKAIHEFLADQFAITENKKWEYAEMLLMQALQTQQSLVNPFFHSHIKRRIAMITLSKKPGHRYARKLLVLPVTAFAFMLFAFSYHEKKHAAVNPDLTYEIELADTTKKPQKTSLIWKDGNNLAELNAGYLWVSEEKSSRKVDIEKKYVVINDDIKPMPAIFNKLIQADSIFVYKPDNKKAIALYGTIAKDGIIVFKNATLTDAFQRADTTRPEKDADKVFDRVEVEPSFRGGDNAWKNFLLKNLDASIPVKNNAPAGTYTVIIMFTVDKNGAISNINPITQYGYGMEKEAMRVIQLSPIWNPANQNGQIVKAIHKQPVTFAVNKKDGTFSATPASADENRVFTKVEIEPYFPGGELKFREYILNYQKNHTKETGGPASPQSVMVEFLVKIDGSVSDIKLAEGTTPSAYATAALDLIKNGPKWNPGVQNGRPVNAYKRQAVIFISPDSQLPGTSQWVEASGSSIPGITVEELRQATVHQLLALPKDAIIVSYTFAIDTDEKTIEERSNNGPYFSSSTKELILKANAGKTITIDMIKIKENGLDKKIPSRVYRVVN